MSYGSVIAKYRNMHRQSNPEEISALWKRSTPGLNIYVHSPFCPSVCGFCHYRGKEFHFEKDYSLYRKYYYDYLPRAIAPFLPIIESRQIGNYFFGGGTPSLMRPETMSFIFDIFPGFKDVKSKTFEIHPAVWTEEQLDVLAMYGFNCCIIGVQSFDESVLDRQGRLYATREQIRGLARKVKDRGMYLAIDMIYRMDPVDADEIFRQDLAFLPELDADIISLQDNFNELYEDEKIKRFFEIVCDSPLAADYYWEEATGENPVMSLDEKRTRKAVRYLRNDLPHETYSNEIFTFLKTIDECSKHFSKGAGYPSLIGFGSYQNSRKNTFSSIRARQHILEYIEVNNNWSPEYYITFDEDRRKLFDETVELMKRFKTLGDPPPGIVVSIINRPAIRDDQCVLRKPHVLVGLEISWKERTVAVDEFIAGIKAVFQHTLDGPSSMLIVGRRS